MKIKQINKIYENSGARGYPEKSSGVMLEKMLGPTLKPNPAKQQKKEKGKV